MKRTLALLPFVLLIARPVSGAGQPALPEGIASLYAPYGPPDLTGFPAGVMSVKTRLHAVRGAGPCRISWAFERDAETGFLVVRHGDIDVLDALPGGRIAPEGAVEPGPLETLRAYLSAAAASDPAGVRSRLCRKRRASFPEDPAEALEAFRTWARLSGRPLDVWAEELTPALGAGLERAASIQVGYRFPGLSGDRKGIFHVDIRLLLEGPEPLCWVVEAFEARFQEKPGAPEPPSGGTENLRDAFRPFAVPDFSAFPGGTEEIELRYFARRRGALYEIRADLEGRRGAPLYLEGFSVKRREHPSSGSVVPDRLPEKGIDESFRDFADAVEAADLSRILLYGPAQELEDMEKRGITREQMKAMLMERLEREKERRGYTPFAVARDRFPALSKEPEALAFLELEFEFPGALKDQQGAWRVEVKMLIDEAKPSRWKVADVDADFYK